jgi:apolipoprotein D and lipocalin family protein
MWTEKISGRAIKYLAVLLISAWTMAGCSTTMTPARFSEDRPRSELKTVARVDIDRYLGTWYEIARYPHSFEENCYASHADYSLRDDGHIRVVNRCRLGGFEGELDEVTGKAWVVDEASRAKLKVQFFWPFSGDYWIIGLDPDYRYAIVGDPDREYLWIMSRKPQMETTLYQQLVRKVETQGYDSSRIIKTPQPQ